MMTPKLPRLPHPRTAPLLLAVAGLLTSGAPGAAQEGRPMTIVDLIEVSSLGDVRLSPDGRQILYVRSDADWEEDRTISHVWRVNADGTDPLQLTNGREGESSPRWSPDGSLVAFLAERDGGEEEERAARQIHLIRNDGGEARRLTEHPTAVSEIAWSPDGAWIYFIAADPETESEKALKKIGDDVFSFGRSRKNDHLWRVRVPTGETERLTAGDFHVRGYHLSRDGRTIVHQRAPSPLLDDGQMSEVLVLSAEGGPARRLTENTIGEGDARLSPDGSTVLFVANSNEDFEFYYNDKIFLVPADGSRRPEALLRDLPYGVRSAEWSADGRTIYFSANTGVRQELFRVGADGSGLRPLTRGDHQVSSWSFSPETGTHVYSLRTPTNAGDVWTLPAEGGEPRRVTRIFDHLAAQYRLPRVEVVEWEGEDGVRVEGLLFYPLDYREGRRYPLVVQTHGGPASSDQLGWHSPWDYVPVLSAMGYFVFQPNYRGSTGYGDAFLRDMVGHYFNQAHKDVMTGVDHLIARGLVDGERMAKMGWSAGGHMTNKIITYTDRFAAASSGAGAVNWISMYAQSDTRVYRTPWFGGTPWGENAPIDQYIEDSPLFDLHRVSTPTLVLVGEDDARVPMPQSVELYRGLKANDVPTCLYVAPEQGHGWRGLHQRLFKANVELDWFERWVRGRDHEWERSPVTPPSVTGEELDRGCLAGTAARRAERP